MADDKQIGPGLYVKLGLDYNGIIGGIGGVSLALNQTLDLFSKFEGMAQGFIDLANNAGAMGKEIKDNARDLGLSVEQYQQWTHAAIAAGSSADEITTSIRQMSVRMKEAADPTSDMGKQLAALGVSVTDSEGNMRSMNDVLLDIFPALNALPEGFARNQAAQEIFGRNFSNIADLAGMSRDQLQALIDQPPAFSTEKVAQLDAYNTQLSLLNEKLEHTKALAGSEMMPAFANWGNAVDYALQKGQPLNVLFKDLNLLLEMTLEGFTLLGSRAIATFDLINPLSGKFGDLSAYSKAISESDATVKKMRYDFAMMEGGLVSDGNGGWINPSYEANSATESVDKVNTALETTNSSLKNVGESAKAVAQTFNTTFSSALATGVVGPDTAGYSDLANMTEDELQAVVDKGQHGGSKEMADRAATYLKLMGSASSADTTGSDTSSGTSSKSTATPGSSEQTADISKEYDKQATDLQKLTVKITAEYKKQSAAFQQYLNDLTTFRATQYPLLEKMDLIHWATQEEIAKVAAQKELDFMAACVNFGGMNPIIQNYIVMSKDGPDWTPPAFTAVTAPQLTSADFTGVGAAVQNIVKAGLGAGTSASVTVTVQQTINGADKDTADKVADATTEGVSKALAGVKYLGGSMV